ncbi:MAG: penicillin-binding protein 2, partial [Gammaproteobacteria bacterium]
MTRKRSRNVPFSANPLLQVRLPAHRSQILMLCVAIGFVALAARAVWLQVFSQDFLQRQGESRYARTVELPASRGKIFDRNGIVLASSLPARAVWATPEQVEATPAKLAQLHRNMQDIHVPLPDEEHGDRPAERGGESPPSPEVLKDGG